MICFDFTGVSGVADAGVGFGRSAFAFFWIGWKMGAVFSSLPGPRFLLLSRAPLLGLTDRPTTEEAEIEAKHTTKIH